MIQIKQVWKIGDCLELLPRIPDKSIDMILTDLPYGSTQNTWDVIINQKHLWLQYNRIIKDNGPIVLFGQGMFSAKMMISNSKMWRYNLIWKKSDRATGFLNANKMPLRNHEDIMIFYKSSPVFNPQFKRGKKTHERSLKNENNNNNNYGNFTPQPTKKYGKNKFPLSVLNFDKPQPSIHPTQKPVSLFEYLIKTYTNEGDTVHDSCLGSGTTLEACYNTNRNCIGFEISDEWEDHYRKRLKSNNSKITDNW